MANSSAKIDKQFAESLADDLGRLDGVAKGLGKATIDFIFTGHPATALIELGNHKDAATQALAPQWHAQTGEDAGDAARKKAVLRIDRVALDVLNRYAHVMLMIDLQIWGIQDKKRSNTLWLRWLVNATLNASRGNVYGKLTDEFLRIWTVARMQDCLATCEEPRETIVDELYGVKAYAWSSMIRELSDLKSYLSDSHDAVVQGAGRLGADARVGIIDDLARFDLANGAYQAFVFKEAISPPKGPAKAARAALNGALLADIAKLAEPVFAGRDGAARRGAAEVLAFVGGRAALPLLKARQKAETSVPVRDALAALIAQIDASATPKAAASLQGEVTDGSVILRAIDGSEIVIPRAPPPPEDTPLPKSALDGLRDFMPAYNKAIETSNREREAEHKANNWTWPFTSQPLVETQALDDLLAIANAQRPPENMGFHFLYNSHLPAINKVDKSPVAAFFARPDVTPWHVLRLIGEFSHSRIFISLATGHSGDGPWRAAAAYLAKPETDFRTFVTMAAKVGGMYRTDEALRQIMTRYQSGLGEERLPLTLQYYILEHLDVFEEAFGLRQPAGGADIRPWLRPDEIGAVRLLFRLDQIPDRLLQPLLSVALTGGRAVRGDARKLLAGAVGIDDAIVARLADPNKEIRASAAAWLADRAPKGAAVALHKMLKKEKADQPRAAMLSALARLGEDISDYFDEKAMKKEAEAGLVKSTIKSLDWFPFSVIPRLRWAGGKLIPVEVVKWWIVLADKLKDPAGNAMFELYLDRLERADAEALGLFIFKTFIDRDTISCSEQEAVAAAEQQVVQHAAWVKQWRAQNPEYKDWTTPEAVFRAAKAAKLAEHPFSCPENKGILGLAVRAPGPEVAALTRNYVKNFGQKVSQTKSLLASLARNPAPAAIQVVLGVSHRVKQKTVQAYAGELIADLAERRGWSSDELADRTIPTAGFDEAGEFTLDCGDDRGFRGVYRGNGTIELVNAQGKPVKSLPAHRHEKEKERVDAAKKQLSTSRKELKQTETSQRERLYEAMCIDRRWSSELWMSCLKEHPIVGRMVQRLLWQGLDVDGKPVATFRVLEDGSGTDADDDPVDLRGFAQIRLAHRALLDDIAAQAWGRHMKDYEMTALFPQLDKPLYILDDKHKGETAIEDRKGFMIESLKLKGIATKLGYQTGEVIDGGAYMDYVKRFNSAGVVVSVGFTGSYMGAGAQVVPAAITELTFKRPGRAGRAVKLGDVPPVLLSEAVADLNIMAGSGTGFDEHWEQKVAF